jgi:hypothetical protein
MLAGNPASSFFYLLTAMHGCTWSGGLVGGLDGGRRVARPQVRMAHALCARYWHFLLAMWLVLFALLGWLTPEVPLSAAHLEEAPMSDTARSQASPTDPAIAAAAGAADRGLVFRSPAFQSRGARR